MRDAAGCRVISVIGAGGKTTLCRALARFLPGRTVYLTSTHMYPPGELPCAVLPAGTPAEAARDLIGHVPEGGGAVVSGPLENGKCTWPGRAAFEAALAAADYVIVEADGARGREIKLHGENEPVIPPEASSSRSICPPRL